MNAGEIVDARAVVDASIDEKSWQETVRQMAIACGWLYYHTHRSERSPAGFPDCVMVRTKPSRDAFGWVNLFKTRLIFAELKRVGKNPTGAQKTWLGTLSLVPGVEVYVWTPADREQAAEVLK